MTLRRYERYNELGPKQSRIFLLIIAVAAVVGLLAGVIWVIAGLMHFR